MEDYGELLSMKVSQTNEESQNIETSESWRDAIILRVEKCSKIGKCLEITFKTTSTIEGGTITLLPKDKNNKKFIFSEYTKPKVRHLYDFSEPLFIKNVYLELRDEETESFYLESSRNANKANQALIGALFVFNMPLALTLMKLLQFFEFFNLFNLDYPGNVLAFFNLFKGGIFSFLPNAF